MKDNFIFDDRKMLNSDMVKINWPTSIKKPRVGIVQDYGIYPSWTKYARFLENNSFPFRLINIHKHNWIDQVSEFDIIVGLTSPSPFDLEELRIKYWFLENNMNKVCFPSTIDMFLWEDKKLETYLTDKYKIPFIRTYISHDKEDALQLIKNLKYPFISKITPSSASIGVEMVHSENKARKIVLNAFSNNGRKTHLVYSRQKNYVYFQEYIRSSGDIRIIVVGNRVFGFYRMIPEGDFRASGMHNEEMKSLPLEAMKIARNGYKSIGSPQFVVDMLRGINGSYYINEFSPVCQMSTQAQLKVDGVPGAYVFEDEENYHFEPGNYWVHELAIKEFFENHYLKKFKSYSRP